MRREGEGEEDGNSVAREHLLLPRSLADIANQLHHSHTESTQSCQQPGAMRVGARGEADGPFLTQTQTGPKGQGGSVSEARQESGGYTQAGISKALR